jgi:threonine synthase
LGGSATDEELLEGIKLLARAAGIFTEPVGGTEVAVTKKLIRESIVVSITGNGYKTPRSRRTALRSPSPTTPT